MVPSAAMRSCSSSGFRSKASWARRRRRKGEFFHAALAGPQWRGVYPAGSDHLSGSGSPGGIGIDQAAPAAAVERRPFAFGLRQTIGHRVNGSGMMAHAAMAAFDLDAFGLRGALFHA